MRHYRPLLTVDQTLAWTDAHYQRTGRWPHRKSGPIPGSVGDTWTAIDMALIQGIRGLPGGDTLARFLALHRGARHPSDCPRLSIAQVLRRADAHRRRTGRWPNAKSSLVAGQGALTWGAVSEDLRKGIRGL